MKINQITEGYSILPSIDRDKYQDREHEGLEGPIMMRNGQVLYYDKRAGKYYNPDVDMFVSDDEFFAMDNYKSRAEVGEDFGSAEEYKKLDKSADLGENRLLKTNKLSSAEYQKAKKLKAFNPSDYTWNPDEQLYVKKANQIDEEAYDAIRDFMGMGMSRAQAEAEARKMYPDEFEQPARRQIRPRNAEKPVLVAMHFFNVSADQESDAKILGLKQTKSGKWYKGEYNTSGANKLKRDLNTLSQVFGEPKRWEPKKKTSEGEQHGNSKVYDKCWSGYKKVPGKKRGEKGSCVKEDTNFKIGDAVASASGGSVTGKVAGFNTKGGVTKIVFINDADGKRYQTTPDNLRVV